MKVTITDNGRELTFEANTKEEIIIAIEAYSRGKHWPTTKPKPITTQPKPIKWGHGKS